MFMTIFRYKVIISTTIIGLAIIFGFVGASISMSSLSTTAYSHDNLIRLHILAHSNSPVDQDLKLKVRDAVLLATNNIFSGVLTQEQAKEYIKDNWLLIEETALKTIKEQGFEYPVNLQLGTFTFPKRNYGNFSLPAGEYEALRIEIGQGVGDNWWCVLFPPLCLAELDTHTETEKLVAASPHLEEGTIEFRLKFWENLSETASAKNLQNWWKSSQNAAKAFALPLLNSK